MLDEPGIFGEIRSTGLIVAESIGHRILLQSSGTQTRVETEPLDTGRMYSGPCGSMSLIERSRSTCIAFV